MGVYNNITITTTDLDQRVGGFVNYLNSLEGIEATQTTENIDSVDFIGAAFSIIGTNISGFFGYKDDDNLKNVALWLKNGDTYLIDTYISDTNDSATNLDIHSYIDEKCILLSVKDLDSNRHGIVFSLIDVENYTKLIGYYKNTGSASFVDISNLSFEDINDPIRILYTYTNMFPYAAPAGQLDFLNQGYFVDLNNIKKFTTEFLKECSTVNILSTASLPYPLGNYLAIGAHCLAPLDEEGGNE